MASIGSSSPSTSPSSSMASSSTAHGGASAGGGSAGLHSSSGTGSSEMERLELCGITTVNRGKWVEYAIQVKKGDIEWTVNRRYSDFELLVQRLKQEFPTKRLHDLPKKEFRIGRSKFDEDFLEQRRGFLLFWLFETLRTVDVTQADCLDDFLEYSERNMISALSIVENVDGLHSALAALRAAAHTTSHKLDPYDLSSDDESISTPPRAGGNRARHESDVSDRSSVFDAKHGEDDTQDLATALEHMAEALKLQLRVLHGDRDDLDQMVKIERHIQQQMMTSIKQRQVDLDRARAEWEQAQLEYQRETKVFEDKLAILNRDRQELKKQVDQLTSMRDKYDDESSKLNKQFKQLRIQLAAIEQTPIPATPAGAPMPTPAGGATPAGTSTAPGRTPAFSSPATLSTPSTLTSPKLRPAAPTLKSDVANTKAQLTVIQQVMEMLDLTNGLSVDASAPARVAQIVKESTGAAAALGPPISNDEQLMSALRELMAENSCMAQALLSKAEVAHSGDGNDMSLDRLRTLKPETLQF